MLVRSFALFIALIVAAEVVYALQITLSVNQKPYTIEFNQNQFTVINLAENFCRELAGEFKIRTMEELVLSCISPMAVEIRREVGRIIDSTSIVQGELSPESNAWLQAANAQANAATATQAAVPAARTSAASLPTDFRVQITGNEQPFTLVIDLNRFTLTSAAEQFCRQRSQELGVTSYELLVNQCIPQVSQLVRAELSKQYNPDTIPLGELSEDSRVGLAKAVAQRREAEVAATTAAAAAAAPEARSLQIRMVANNKPYTIVADLSTFTLLTTAETFCRQKAAELGITTLESLVLRCIPTIANYIKDELSTQFNSASIPEGDLSAESNQWFEQYRAQQRALAIAQEQAAAQAQAQAQAAQKTVFEIAVPIDNVPYTVRFDTRVSTPMAVAEALCSSQALGITSLEVLVRSCLPPVSNYIKQAVDAAIAPNTIAVGDYSATLRNAVAEYAKRQQQN